MIPEGWRVEKLNNISSLSGGTTPSKDEASYWNGEVFWATPSDVTLLSDSQLYISNTENKITEIALKNTGVKLLPIGSVLMTSRATIGEVVINTIPITTNQGFCNFIPNEKIINEYLAYWLKNSKNIIRAISSGSTFLEVSKTALRNLELPIPPLPEQKKIAEVLGSVDAAIEATKAVIEQSKKVKQGLLQTLLTRGIGHTKFKPSPLGEIPENWEVKTLGELLDNIKGGGTPSKKNSEYWNGTIPWASVKDLTNQYLEKTEDYITELGLKESASNLIPAGTIIIATRMAVGKAIKFTCDVSINQDLKALFPKSELNNRFLFVWLYANSEKIEKLASGSTVMGIRLESLNSINFALPPIQEQKAIAEIFDSIDEQITAETTKLASLQQLKKGLMHDLLTGKVRVV